MDPGGLDLDLCGRDACGDGSDGDGGKDGSMGLGADAGAVLEVEGALMAPGEVLPQRRQFPWGRTTRKRRNAARMVASSSGLLMTSERLSYEHATKTQGDDDSPHEPE